MILGLGLAALASAQAGDKLEIRGSDTFGLELGPRLVQAFQERHPGAELVLENIGTASGFDDLLEDRCDILATSRMLTDEEFRMARSRGIELQSALVGYNGVAVIVHAGNPVKNLTDVQVRDLFAGRVTRWSQVGGADRPVELFIRDASGGTHLGFRRLAMDHLPYAAAARAQADYAALADAVAANPDAIGHIGMGLAARPGIHYVSVNGIPPDEVTVHDGLYPYVQAVWLYARAKSDSPRIEQFMQFVRSKAGQQIVEATGFVGADLGPIGFKPLFFLVFAVLGGLALFIYGMNIMTDGLREAAGQRLRSILSVMTTRKLSGLGLGSLLGTLIHSSAATVMLVGFIQAGLMNLIQAVPVMLGANIGTTLSMQAISFKLGDYALFAVAAGFIMSMLSKTTKRKKIGLSLMGFGLLFLGMTLMSDAIKPYRELLRP
ncbi:MAG: Na/Pi symporter, partial [Kiritimatiellae bacterium]|nr:Na/Pi symporter [Kiritimatiellia bacterium]